MSDPSDNSLRNLIREIHRRSLWQVLGIYVASWLVPSHGTNTTSRGWAPRIRARGSVRFRESNCLRDRRRGIHLASSKLNEAEK